MLQGFELFVLCDCAFQTPISPLRLLIPENYPNSSPILIDRAPVEPW